MERRAVTGNFACQGSLDITIKTNQQSPELPFYFLLTLEKSEDTFIFDIKGNRHRIQVLHPGGKQLGKNPQTPPHPSPEGQDSNSCYFYLHAS